MKISFLLHNRYGIGGAIRSVLNLSAALAERHDVEIVSTLRDRAVPSLSADPRVRVRDLVDLRETSHVYDGDVPLASQPARIFPESDQPRWGEVTRLTEMRLAQYLATTDADVVVATNPGLAVCLAAMASGNYLRVVQEHSIHSRYPARLRDELAAFYSGVDAVVAVSEQDAEYQRTALRASGVAVHCIPNCVPTPPVAPSTGENKVVMAAGRLVPGKQYDLLVEAFGKVVAQHPDWELRLFGRGPERGRLRRKIDELGLYNNVFLMGASSQMETEWPKASLAVSSSRAEALPMNIIEAMHAGLPVVSTDCDFGPREIIRHGEDGLLTPVGSSDVLASSLITLINDVEWRTEMSQQARKSAQRYAPEAVTAQYKALFEELTAQRAIPAEADCRVAGPGDIVVRLAADDGPDLRYHLLCVNRHASGDAEADAVRFPLRPEISPTPDGPGSPGAEEETDGLVAVIPWRGESLPEGVWDVFVEAAASGLRRRVRVGVCDQRELLPPAGPHPDSPVLQARIPYATPAGLLSVRSWVRDLHVEADRVKVSDGRITIEAEVWGAALESGATLLARSRQRRECDFELPVERVGGGRFRVTVPCARPALLRTTEHDVWDLYLRRAKGSSPIRIGRFQGDLHERKSVCSYPYSVIEENPRGRARVRAFYTVNCELSVNAVDLSDR